MKLRNKIFAGFAAMVLVLTLMTGTVMASTDVLPFDYPNEAGATTNNDVWVKLIGGGTVISTADVSANVKSVDVTITGKATFDAQFIINSDAGWNPVDMAGNSVDGSLVLSVPMDGSVAPSYCEIVINITNKSEGPLAVAMMEFKDADGNVLVTRGEAVAEVATDDAATDTAATDTAAADETASIPKTGAESFGAIYGLAATLFASGTVILRKRQK